jgi:hypothetical protein
MERLKPGITARPKPLGEHNKQRVGRRVHAVVSRHRLANILNPVNWKSTFLPFICGVLVLLLSNSPNLLLIM